MGANFIQKYSILCHKLRGYNPGFINNNNYFFHGLHSRIEESQSKYFQSFSSKDIVIIYLILINNDDNRLSWIVVVMKTSSCD
jgi:hypothetical protein